MNLFNMPHKNKSDERKWRKKWWSLLSKERKQEMQAKANLRNRQLKLFLAKYKLEKGCKDCGFNKHHAALDFDHVLGEKKFNVCLAKSISQAKEEIKKCDVVCANCHRVRSYNRMYPCKPDIFEQTYEKV